MNMEAKMTKLLDDTEFTKHKEVHAKHQNISLVFGILELRKRVINH